MTIGERIKVRREALGMSQDELAKRVGYKSRSSINKIELDLYSLKQSKIKAIADALETSPGYIMGWEEEIPTLGEEDGRVSEFEELYGQLTADHQKMIIAQIRGILLDKEFYPANLEGVFEKAK